MLIKLNCYLNVDNYLSYYRPNPISYHDKRWCEERTKNVVALNWGGIVTRDRLIISIYSYSARIEWQNHIQFIIRCVCIDPVYTNDVYVLFWIWVRFANLMQNWHKSATHHLYRIQFLDKFSILNFKLVLHYQKC